ncbi:recombinase family protein [Oceanobacillus salinisoli]|uniref:recombinase family protein n=1 Tax=Oceanobacillus salinisoli TaxID=2678611 RepID=UPI0012E0DD68|nr:recombinase family protein [Oceanobacillus salinisoli]
MTKRAAIYARVSTEEQTKGFSLGSQVDQLETYLNRKGYKDLEVFIDDGYSGKDFNRPNIQRLIKNLSSFDAIAVWKVDRLSRNNEQVLSLINNYLKPYDKKLLISTCDIDSSTANGYMFISLLGTFAEYERSQIIERVSSGMKKRAESGKWNGGIILGYDTEEGELKVNEYESNIVKEIFELRASGHGYKSIVNHINTKGFKTKKDKAFGINSVKTILENPTYAGFIRWGKHLNWSEKRRSGKQTEVKLVKGRHEAIIERELWTRVQEVGEEQKKFIRTSNFEGEFVLSGILKCPQCGKGMVMSKTKKSDKEYYLYYQCQNFHQRGLAACNSNLVVKEDIEKQVLLKVKNLMNSPKLIEELCSNIEEERTEDIQKYRIELGFLQKELKEKMEEEAALLAKARQAIKAKNENEEKNYNLMLNQTVGEREDIEKKVNEYEIFIKNHSSSLNITNDQIITALRDFDELLQIADNKTKKVLLRSIIKGINLSKDRKSIKSLTLWFEEGDDTPSPPPIFFGDIFPVNDERRAVPQIRVMARLPNNFFTET